MAENSQNIPPRRQKIGAPGEMPKPTVERVPAEQQQVKQPPQKTPKEPEETTPERQPVKKIGFVMSTLWIVLAIVVDILQGVLVETVFIGTIIDIVFAVIFSIWLLLTKRVSKQLVRVVGGTFLAEFIPVINVVPFWTPDVIYVIRSINSGRMKTYGISELWHGGWIELTTDTVVDVANPTHFIEGLEVIPGADTVGDTITDKLTEKARNKINDVVKDTIKEKINTAVERKTIPRQTTGFDEDIEQVQANTQQPSWNQEYVRARQAGEGEPDAKIRERTEATVRQERREREKVEARRNRIEIERSGDTIKARNENLSSS